MTILATKQGLFQYERYVPDVATKDDEWAYALSGNWWDVERIPGMVLGEGYQRKPGENPLWIQADPSCAFGSEGTWGEVKSTRCPLNWFMA